MRAAIALLLICLFGLIQQGSALKCLECNVWKAGYGHMCDNPRVRDDCTVCMKTETTIFMGYYKDTPRTSTTISRICGKSGTVHYGHECHYYTSSDGHDIRCYCDEDLCNASSPLPTSGALLLASLSFVLCKALW
ncbi:hypothetical protein CAPTEDRAFT_223747 [Capitella teleta]|uniref:Protein sleepless n=1 Tax=Capitella teleta TaxID=283909 RepID=R7TFP7_CAPTE|nr:hypothetical protein CAPTEDRAFT_223747 [Capitella teleta]|eukprot:ELT89871.1 hypothetical protein CAPTEDRAFT_223747 [Capitella teleta]